MRLSPPEHGRPQQARMPHPAQGFEQKRTLQTPPVAPAAQEPQSAYLPWVRRLLTALTLDAQAPPPLARQARSQPARDRSR